MHAGIKKLREKDIVIDNVEEEADGGIKAVGDIPTVIAEDTVSQVPVVVICYQVVISTLMNTTIQLLILLGSCLPL